jgi:hypothetical protein
MSFPGVVKFDLLLQGKKIDEDKNTERLGVVESRELVLYMGLREKK